MRAYRVHVTIPDGGHPDDAKLHQRFAGTMALAKDERLGLVNDYQVKKGAVEIEEIEIPTSKTELIAFVNSLITPA